MEFWVRVIVEAVLEVVSSSSSSIVGTKRTLGTS
jgi:hypothetical protein